MILKIDLSVNLKRNCLTLIKNQFQKVTNLSYNPKIRKNVVITDVVMAQKAFGFLAQSRYVNTQGQKLNLYKYRHPSPPHGF